MMFTSPMSHLTAVVPGKSADAVSRKLLSLGMLDFVRMEDFAPEEISLLSSSGGTVPDSAGKASLSRLTEDRLRIENIAFSLNGFSLNSVPLSVDTAPSLDVVSLEQSLDDLGRQLQEIRNRQQEINREILKLEEFRGSVSGGDAGQSGLDPAQFSTGSGFLAYLTGSIPADVLESVRSRLKRFPSVAIELPRQEDRLPLLIMVLKRDLREAEAALFDSGWVEGKLPVQEGHPGREALASLEGKIRELKTGLSDTAAEYTRCIEDKREWLTQSWTALLVHERLQKISLFYTRTRRTVLFSGWIPRAKCRELEDALREVVQKSLWLEWHSPQEVNAGTDGRVKVPVELDNPGFLKPFEMLVENYSVPAYGTVDPTAFVAVAFLCMFGLMFGDAGQGLVLILAGLLAPRVMKNASSGMRRLFTLITYCGTAAVVSGLLFGSFFGYPLLPPLWFNYHALVNGHASGSPAIRSVYDILLITIYFGISIIALGLFINWINLLKQGDWFSLVFEKGGFLGGWIYGWGIYTAFFFAGTGYRSLPPGWQLIVGFLLPALVLFFKHPVSSAHHGNTHIGPGMIMTFLMEWVVELLEIFSGYLANTLSFMRVAGLGIAHVSLMTAFDQIAAMTTSDGGVGPWSVLILILGNVLVILLEGLSAGIQSLRLNYYEFFSKYFSGSGKAYAPISLRNN